MKANKLLLAGVALVSTLALSTHEMAAQTNPVGKAWRIADRPHPRYVADGTDTPATLLGNLIPWSESPLNTSGISATEDDVSVLWLKKGVKVDTAVDILENDATEIGLGEILYGATLAPNYNIGGLGPGQDSRTPDIIVTPNIGVTYSSSTAMIGDHGGFAHDDTNVMLLVANPSFSAQTVSAETATIQVAPTILKSVRD